jgi:hypothetical protein
VSEPLPPERPYPLDHEGRIARLEGIIEQIDVRLGRVEAKIDTNRQSLETKIDTNRQSLETKIDSLLRWIIALQVATWGLIGALKLFG